MAAREITALFRSRMSTARAALLQNVARLWLAAFNPDEPITSLTRIGAVAGQWTVAAQAAAAAEARTYLAALVADATRAPVTAVAGLPAPAGIVGLAANGRPVSELTGLAPAVYWARTGAGQSRELGAAAALSWVNRVAASEPYRAANESVNYAAAADERFTGRVIRWTRPGACKWCVMIADRGYIPVPAEGPRIHANFAAHPNCQCTPAPEISSYATSRAAVSRGRAALQAPPAPPPRAPAGTNYILAGFGDLAQDVNATAGRALARIQPRIAQRLRMVEAAPSDPGMKAGYLGYYQRGANIVTINPVALTAQGKQNVANSIRAGWFSKSDAEDHVITHEIGHFLHDQIPFDREIELRDQLYNYLYEKRGVTLATAAEAGVTWSRGFVEDEVSAYASTNFAELVAESWAEYVLSPTPRPVPQMIGDWIVRELG